MDEIQSALEVTSKYKNKKYAGVGGVLIIEVGGGYSVLFGMMHLFLEIRIVGYSLGWS